jgi:hypothetical protein
MLGDQNTSELPKWISKRAKTGSCFKLASTGISAVAIETFCVIHANVRWSAQHCRENVCHGATTDGTKDQMLEKKSRAIRLCIASLFSQIPELHLPILSLDPKHRSKASRRHHPTAYPELPSLPQTVRQMTLSS